MTLDFLLIKQYLLYILGTELGSLTISTKIVDVDSIMENVRSRRGAKDTNALTTNMNRFYKNYVSYSGIDV